ncbi:MAG: polymerase primary sigma factor [Humisphaera sp.]|nr:polymerase primary sigma factor [Humisphaera sp.]
MAKFRIDNLAALARQMEFTPTEARATQVAAAEQLLHSIEPGKAYPLDFITFKITGFHPRHTQLEELAGMALQHDLGLLIEHVSETLDVPTITLAEPVLMIEDVTERFNVTSKTIQRWRRRGLPARRFVFPDGKRRVGFLLSSVERFFASHRDQVARGTNFSQVDDGERDEILRRARRLASLCHCCVNEISRRIARKLNRSPATILHTIRKHDQEEPAQAIFTAAAPPIGDDERARLVRLYRRGATIKTLAKRSCRPRSAIYRLLLDERIAKLNRRKVKFIDDELYHQSDADMVVETLAKEHETIDVSPRPAKSSTSFTDELRMPRDVPSAIASLCSAPLLTPARERALFLKFNYHKMRFVSARRRLEPDFARVRDLNVLEGHLRRAGETKNLIVRSNLRLVVSIARKHLRPGLSLMELVSDGTMTLMRAIESFDVHRGNKFSTYATLALMKGFARSVPQMLTSPRGRGQQGEEFSIEIPDRRATAAAERFLAREEVSQLLQRLDARERDVVRGHFGLDESAPATYDQLAQRLGLSKERVRQIERVALAKLRGASASARERD